MEKTMIEKEAGKEIPRIPPIEQPKGIKLKLAYWLTKKKIGKVITPVKVVQAGYRIYVDDKLHSIWSFSFRDGKINRIYAILNPSKVN